MSKKQITITLTPQNKLELVPQHLKKPDTIDLNIDGLNPLEAIGILTQTLNSLVANYQMQIAELANNINQQTKN